MIVTIKITHQSLNLYACKSIFLPFNRLPLDDIRRRSQFCYVHNVTRLDRQLNRLIVSTHSSSATGFFGDIPPPPPCVGQVRVDIDTIYIIFSPFPCHNNKLFPSFGCLRISGCGWLCSERERNAIPKQKDMIFQRGKKTPPPPARFGLPQETRNRNSPLKKKNGNTARRRKGRQTIDIDPKSCDGGRPFLLIWSPLKRQGGKGNVVVVVFTMWCTVAEVTQQCRKVHSCHRGQKFQVTRAQGGRRRRKGQNHRLFFPSVVLSLSLSRRPYVYFWFFFGGAYFRLVVWM